MSGFEPGEGWREITFKEACEGGREIISHRRAGPGPSAYTYWAREVPVLPLPTEPGYYLAEQPSYGDTVVVELLGSPKGQWVDAGDRNYLQPDDVRVLGPLVRLEPRAETARAVLARVREHVPIYGDKDRMWDIAREFGVDA